MKKVLLNMNDELHATIMKHKGPKSATVFINEVLTDHFTSQGISISPYPGNPQKISSTDLKALLTLICERPGITERHIMEELRWSRQNLRTRLSALEGKKMITKRVVGKANCWSPKGL